LLMVWKSSIVSGMFTALAIAIFLVVVTVVQRFIYVPLRDLEDGARRVSTGDRTHLIPVRSHDEIGRLAEVLRTMIRKVSNMVAAVGSDAALVAHAGQQLSEGNRDLADRTDQQAASLEQTSASVQELVATVRQNAQAAGRTAPPAAQSVNPAVLLPGTRATWRSNA